MTPHDCGMPGQWARRLSVGPWSALTLAAMLLVGACEAERPRLDNSEVSGVQVIPAVNTPSGTVTPPSSVMATSSPAISGPANLGAELLAADSRFHTSPPVIHGTYEYRSERETITYELWIDWPAFRFSMTARENDGPPADKIHEPFVVATLDGKRFGVRDPLADGPYVTRSFGETAWILAPLVNYFGPPIMLCTSGHVAGTDEVLGRSAILFRCTDEPFDSWVDRQTGLVLRQVVPDPDEGEPGWQGFVRIEFDPPLDRSMFDPRSV